MASIDIENASVSYFLRSKGGGKRRLERALVGGQIITRQRYVEIAALKNISLSLKDGDRIGLIGLNGSGKSTLLHLCAGALVAQSGSIRIEGRVSPQFSLGAGVKPALTGRRNAELKCLYMGIAQRSIGARVDEIKELSGLGGYFELPVSTYSAGMRSRLVMSMLRLVRAEILVIDEWIGAADRTVNKTLGILQQDLMAAATIVVMASHSQKVLSSWTNKLLWLDAGEIRAFGPTEEIYAEYEASFGDQ